MADDGRLMTESRADMKRSKFRLAYHKENYPETYYKTKWEVTKLFFSHASTEFFCFCSFQSVNKF